MEAEIRKVYVAGGPAGSSREYWEHTWQGSSIDAALEEARSDPRPLWRQLERWVPDSGRVLEAGCGAGSVLAYLRQCGASAVGIDYAEASLHSAKGQVSSLPLAVADVARMPFRDGTFDCVVSMGVVEHFEGGPAPVLREHRRVMRENGLLLIAVPRLSIAKRWNDWTELRLAGRPHRVSKDRVVTRVTSPRVTPTPSESLSFHQYEFPRHFVMSMLGSSGFEVRSIQPIETASGLGESKWVQRVSRGRRRSRGPGPKGSGARATSHTNHRRSFGAAAWFGRAWEGMIQERTTSMPTRVLTRLGESILGHMLFVVAIAV
jgi:SAM-dependent methyltransferase